MLDEYIKTSLSLAVELQLAAETYCNKPNEFGWLAMMAKLRITMMEVVILVEAMS